MIKLVKSLGLIFALGTFIVILILIPAWQFKVIGNWQVSFLSISYFVFFLGTIWRVIRYGELANRQEDRQFQAKSGRLASIITITSLIGFHWLTIYTFSRQNHQFHSTTNQYLTLIGISLVCVAIIISQIAIRTLGKFFDRLIIKTDHQLVTEGIYSFIRHPIYTSYILLFLGFCLILPSLSGFALCLVTCIVWFSNRISIEEQMLKEKFGEEYLSYCQQTKRLFPFINN